MTSFFYEVFWGPDIWAPALFSFLLAFFAQIMISQVAGPIQEGRLIYRDGYVDIIIWLAFVLCFLWSLGRQVYAWFQALL